MDPAVLVAVACPGGGGGPWSVAAGLLVARGHGGVEHVVVETAGGSVRVDVVAGTVSPSPGAFQVMIDVPGCHPLQRVALDRLLMCADPRRQPPPRACDRRLSRLIEALRVADALAEGASLAMIAAGLAGVARRELDWPGEGEHLKSATRRKVLLARQLVAAGPRGVLAHTI